MRNTLATLLTVAIAAGCSSSRKPHEVSPHIQTVLSAVQKEQFKPVAIELTKGMATFHHPLMLHGSFENNTDGPRRAAVINVFRDGVRSASNDPLLEGVPPIPAGEPMGGQFFPKLFDPQGLGDGE